jgi:hypothetical protein
LSGFIVSMVDSKMVNFENMEILKYKLISTDLDQLVNYLADHLPFDYENHGRDMSVLAQEEYHLRSTSTQLNMVIAKREAEYILLDIIGSAGGSGMFNSDFGSEKGYLNTACAVLERFVEEHGCDIEELDKMD